MVCEADLMVWDCADEEYSRDEPDGDGGEGMIMILSPLDLCVLTD